MAKLNKLWVVLRATEDSEFADVFAPVKSVTELANLLKGSLYRNDVYGIYDNEREAKKAAESLISKPDKFPRPPRIRLWMVTKADRDSEFGDIFIPVTSAEDMRLQFRGGLEAREVAGIYNSEAEAKKVANKLLKGVGESDFTSGDVPEIQIPLKGRLRRRRGGAAEIVPDAETNSRGDWILRAISGTVSSKK